MMKKAIPTGRILHGIRSRKWTIAEAIAELIDNSFGELRGKAETVTIQWDAKKRVLGILDNGRGMKDVSDLFTLGEGTVSGAGDIGVFGMGGSEALLWLADIAIVETLRADLAGGRVARGRANWKTCVDRQDFPTIDNQWRYATPATCTTELLEWGHGTLILLRLRDGLIVRPEFIRDQLSRWYGVGLRTGRRIDWIDGIGEEAVVTPVQSWNPGEMKDVITATVKISQGLSAQVVAGRVDGLSVRNSKLAVNYLYRQVKETNEGFGRTVQGAVGYVDLSPEWLQCLTTTKDDIREDCRHLEAELMRQIAEVLRPLIDTLEQAKLEKVFTNVKINLKRKLEAGLQHLTIADPDGLESDVIDISAELPGGGGNGFDGPGYKRPRKPRKPEQLAATIEIKQVTDEANEGLLCKVIIDRIGEVHTATAFINKEHELVKMALLAEPINQRLLEHILIAALSTEIVKTEALVSFGIFTPRQLERLNEKFRNDDFSLVLHLIRVLTDGVVKEGEAA
jgi:Histidine kinase-, DNA gyrase B-, and HSP90-like ATPase